MKTANYQLTLISLLLILAFDSDAIGQNGIRAFGIQYKPIFPSSLVNTDGQIAKDKTSDNELQIQVKTGFSIGAVIRMGISKRWSFETGINYVRRNYDFKLSSPDFKDSETSVNLNGYEIPAIALAFVRLGENLFMNASGGLTFDLFPTGGIAAFDRDSIEYAVLESKWFIPALSANLGFEYRTEKHGYFYIGSSYHLPFSDIGTVFVSYRKSTTNSYIGLISPPPSLSGTYFTLDLRYFFNSGMKEKKEKGR